MSTLLAVATLAIVAALITIIPITEIMALTVLITAAVGLFVMSAPSMTLQPYSFGTLSVLYIAFVGGLQPLYRITQNEVRFFDWNVEPLLARASAVTAVSLAGFIAGYLVLQPKRTQPTMSRALPRPHRFAILAGVVGLIMYAAWLALSGSAWSTGLKLLGETASDAPGSGPSVGYLYLGLDLIMASAVFAIASASLKRRRAQVVLILGASLITFALFGFRYRLMILVIAAIALLRVARMYRVRLRHMLVVVVAASVGFTLIGIYRAPAASQATVTYRSSAIGSFDLSAALAIAVDEVPARRGYLSGRSYVPILTQWIPAALWEEKPRPATIGLLADLTAPGAGSALPFWGEVYVNFGWVGAGIAMFLFGAGCRHLDHRLVASRNWFSTSMLGIGLGFTIHVLSRGNLANQVSVAAVLFGVPYLAVNVWRRLSGKADQRPYALSQPSVRGPHRSFMTGTISMHGVSKYNPGQDSSRQGEITNSQLEDT